jgi:hypothetical protein
MNNPLYLNEGRRLTKVRVPDVLAIDEEDSITNVQTTVRGSRASLLKTLNRMLND